MHEDENTASLCTHICLRERKLSVYLVRPLSLILCVSLLWKPETYPFSPWWLHLCKACCLEVQSTHNRSHKIIMSLHTHTPLSVSGFCPRALSRVSQAAAGHMERMCDWIVTAVCLCQRPESQLLIQAHEHPPIHSRTHMSAVVPVCVRFQYQRVTG